MTIRAIETVKRHQIWGQFASRLPVCDADNLAWALFTAVAALVGAVFVIELWQADFRVPFRYVGTDFYATAITVRSLIEEGWPSHNPFIGAPLGLDWGDFPLPHAIHFCILKFIAVFTHDYGAAINVYWVAAIPLTALTAFFASRWLGLPMPWACCAALLYALNPYHFLRNENHLFYAQLYLIPLGVWAYVFVERGVRSIHSGPMRGVLAIAFLLGCDNQYIAFFFTGLFLLAAVYAFAVSGTLRVALGAVAAAGTVVGALAINLLPNVFYILANGVNGGALARGVRETEIAGLKLTQLLLPIEGHRIPALAAMTHWYNQHTPQLNENSTATLGLVGSTGFLFLIAVLFLRKLAGSNERLPSLARFVTASFLIGTIGGFGALFAYFVTPDIRAYNRISPLIAYASIYAAVWAISILSARLTRLPAIGAALVVALIGIADETSAVEVPPYAKDVAIWRSDDDFVRSIAEHAGATGTIYELPYRQFPEGGATEGTANEYWELRPYLHSSTLHWTYGAMKDRESDNWNENESRKGLRDMLDDLAAVQFEGVLLERDALSDNGASVEGPLRAILREPPIVTADGTMAFYPLTSYTARVTAEVGSAALAQRRERLTSVYYRWGAGFSYREGAGEQTFHWANKDCELVVRNTSSSKRRVRFVTTIIAGDAGVRNLRLDLPDGRHDLTFGANGIPLDFTLDVLPGKTPISLHSDGYPVPSAGDSRTMYFRLQNTTLSDLGPVR